MFKTKIEKLKVIAACHKLGIDEDEIKKYVILNTLSGKGMTKEEDFEVPKWDIQALYKLAGAAANAVFENNYSRADGDFVRRMGREEIYRKRVLETFNEQVKPIIGQMKLTDIISAYFS